MDLMKLSRLIAERRKALGFTQAELGRLLDVTDKAVSKWERGLSAPDVAIINRLAAMLRVSLDEILGERINDGQSSSRMIETDRVAKAIPADEAYVKLDDGAHETVSAKLFGVNIEHTRSDIYNGLSAQMLRNRKFAGKPGAVSGHAGQWYPIGERATLLFDKGYTRHHELYHMKRRNECNSQRIVNIYEGSECGIGQHELALQADKSYAFRMVAQTSEPVEVTVAFASRHGVRMYSCCKIMLESAEWTTYEAVLKSPVDDMDADIRITFSSCASVCIGALSLMPDDTFRGMRRDVIERLKELGVTILRWPGGNFAGEYNWLDGLLPVDMRSPLEAAMGLESQPHTLGFDFHEINTDDFIALCREVGAEPFITINPCWNTPEENAAWVEYCNGDQNTRYGRLRAERGHAEPYNVRLWSLGNEFGYGHMEGDNTPEGYFRIASQHAARMLEVSPWLRLCSCGPYPNTQWAQKSAIPLANQAGLVSTHYYAPNIRHLTGVDDASIAGEYYATISGVEEMRGLILRHRADLPDDLRISMDEWNVWYAWYRPSCVADGIFTALVLHMLMSEADAMGLEQACHFEAINEGLLCVGHADATLTAQGQMFRLMKRHAGGAICCRGAEAFATCKDGVTTLTAVNASYDGSKRVTVSCDGEVSARLYTSESVLPPSSFTEQDAAFECITGGVVFTMPPHSVLAVTLR